MSLVLYDFFFSKFYELTRQKRGIKPLPKGKMTKEDTTCKKQKEKKRSTTLETSDNKYDDGHVMST